MTLTVNNITTNFTTFPNINNGNYKQKKKISGITKFASAAGSTIGITAALMTISKKSGGKLSEYFKNFLNTIKKAEFNDKNVIFIASASTAGGFAGGALTDRKNIKAKAKEGLVQLIGNYIIPSLFVGAGINLNKKIIDANTNLKNSPKSLKLMYFLTGMASLATGVLFGNLVSEKLNTNIFNEKSVRPVNWKDWAEQFDNVCLVTSMATTGTTLAKTVSKAIPLAHFLPGYITGTKTENK